MCFEVGAGWQKCSSELVEAGEPPLRQYKCDSVKEFVYLLLIYSVICFLFFFLVTVTLPFYHGESVANFSL